MTGSILDTTTSRHSSDHARRLDPELTFEDVLRGLQASVAEWLSENPTPRVLDAGCGGRMHLNLGADAYVVGIDVSAEQLERNATLSERILGDIQTVRLDPESFDLVVCWDVLEHLRYPRRALENLRQALRPGGLLIIGGPNTLSLKGLATWMTPFCVHRAWYRWSHRKSPGIRPFKTYRRLAATPRRINTWTKRQQLITDYFVAYESPMQLEIRYRLGLTGRLWSVIQKVVRLATRGRLDLTATDFMLVVRR